MIKAKKNMKKLKSLNLSKRLQDVIIFNGQKRLLELDYGAVGNQYFRYYDVRQASGITTAGQFIIRFIEKKVNEYLNACITNKR